MQIQRKALKSNYLLNSNREINLKALGEENVIFQFSAEYIGKGNVEPCFISTQVPFTIDYQ
ncbi:hypothetical protein [Actinobacillus minor]|uniref:hypothetical protein n=1 Tax=Actinobacillus minor TaxID=51047 RepID=UPI0023F463DD|nr:hypothetical protein [Actinobacillus minor]MDD6910792.1 hypothetical protein [Actinobacillus minor]MDY4712220.1 hypothetical protein [Actinobacillus minor]